MIKTSAVLYATLLACIVCAISVDKADAYSVNLSGNPVSIRIGQQVTAQWSGYDSYSYMHIWITCPAGTQSLACVAQSPGSYTFYVENFTTTPAFGCRVHAAGATVEDYECVDANGSHSQSGTFMVRAAL